MTLDCNNIKLEQGSKGEKVKEVQTILKNLGFYGGKLDGDFGEVTSDAVKKFQRSKGLAVDGWIGSVTCKALQTNKTASSDITPFATLRGKKIVKSEILRAAQVFRKHIHNNHNYPNYITMTDANGNTYNVGRSAYMGLFEDVSIFYLKNGRVPNYVVLSSTSNNPLVIDYQNNGYNCGPTSLSMCFQMLAYWVSEPTLAREMGTNSNGTSPSQLIKGASTHGFDLEVINRNSTAVCKALDEGCPVLVHIHTSYAGGKSCLGYYGAYGHYVMCYGYLVKNGKVYYLIADPTKGFKTCLSTSIDNARSSTNMKYYRVNPKG